MKKGGREVNRVTTQRGGRRGRVRRSGGIAVFILRCKEMKKKRLGRREREGVGGGQKLIHRRDKLNNAVPERISLLLETFYQHRGDKRDARTAREYGPEKVLWWDKSASGRYLRLRGGKGQGSRY